MTYVPHNTFLSQISLPAGAPITSDPFEFSGYAINFVSGSCPVPFGSATGLQYCQDICVNSCPELNPDAVAGVKQMIAQDSTLIGYVDSAVSVFNTTRLASTALVNVTGSHSFAIPVNTVTSDVNTVLQNIQTQLPLMTPFPLKASV